MSDRVSIKVLPTDLALIKKFQKSRSIEDDNEGIDRFFDIARSRINALANYAEKVSARKPKREKKVAKAKTAKVSKKAAKAKKALSKPSKLAAKKGSSKASKKSSAKKSGLGKPSAFAKKAAESKPNSAGEHTAEAEAAAE